MTHQPEDAMHRSQVGKGSRKQFNRRASKTARINKVQPHRGGIRL